jgi:hypothetical protein
MAAMTPEQHERVTELVYLYRLRQFHTELQWQRRRLVKRPYQEPVRRPAADFITEAVLAWRCP